MVVVGGETAKVVTVWEDIVEVVAVDSNSSSSETIPWNTKFHFYLIFFLYKPVNLLNNST